MSRIWWAATVMAALCAVLVATAGSAAASSPPATDFGSGGRVTAIGGLDVLRGHGHEYSAVAGDGDIYVAAESAAKNQEFSLVQLRLYLPDGGLDPTFGNGGSIVVERAAGMDFQLSDLLVDTNGLPYLVGTAFGPRTNFVFPWPGGPIRASDATVMRFTASGALDPTWGTGGVARSNFGLPTPSGYGYAGPPVFGLSAAIDQQDRVLLVVGEQEVQARGVHPDFYEVPQFLTRLSPSGAVDGAFGAGGLAPIPGKVVYGLGADQEGRVQLGVPATDLSRDDTSVGLLRLLADGLPVGSFGNAGVRDFGRFGPGEALAVESDGGSLVLGWDPQRRPHRGGTVTPVMKVGSRRGLPQGLGGDGVARIHLPGHSFLDAIISDRHGGAYLTGALVTRPPGVKGWQRPRRRGLVVHLLADGELDPDFGVGGRLPIAGPGEVIAHGARITAGGRRLLVDGTAKLRDHEYAHQFLAEYHLEAPVIFYGFGPGQLP